MANISKVTLSQGTPINLIATNRLVSTFAIVGGPREPGGTYKIRDDVTGKNFTLDLLPKFAGQVIYTNTIGSDYTAIQYAARLFLVVEDSDPLNPTGLEIVPVINPYAEFYLDPTTGKEWDPVATYVCDPPYLCPET